MFGGAEIDEKRLSLRDTSLISVMDSPMSAIQSQWAAISAAGKMPRRRSVPGCSVTRISPRRPAVQREKCPIVTGRPAVTAPSPIMSSKTIQCKVIYIATYTLSTVRSYSELSALVKPCGSGGEGEGAGKECCTHGTQRTLQGNDC